MTHNRKSHDTTAGDLVGLTRRHTTAAVLFHHALAERLGLGPTDLKCLDLLREHGSMTGSDLAALTGLTTGAITGVVARLEQAGFVRRTPDAEDGRRQILSPTNDRAHDVHALFKRLHGELATMLADFSARDLAAIGEFLTRSTELIYAQIAQLRAEKTLGHPARTPQARKAGRR
jgi:DNA-binding MarR family transcriptional regulator